MDCNGQDGKGQKRRKKKNFTLDCNYCKRMSTCFYQQPLHGPNREAITINMHASFFPLYD